MFLLSISSRRFKIDIGTEGTKSICLGFMKTVSEISDHVTQDMLEDLHEAYSEGAQEVNGALSHGKDKSGMFGLNRVNTTFLGQILKIFVFYSPRMKILLSSFCID
jgi:hypothetical protein